MPEKNGYSLDALTNCNTMDSKPSLVFTSSFSLIPFLIFERYVGEMFNNREITLGLMPIKVR